LLTNKIKMVRTIENTRKNAAEMMVAIDISDATLNNDVGNCPLYFLNILKTNI